MKTSLTSKALNELYEQERAQRDSFARIRKELRSARVRRAIRAIERAAHKAGATVLAYYSSYDGANLYINLNGLTSFNERRVHALLATIDKLVPFESSSDEADGRYFVGRTKPSGLFVRCALALKDPDGNKNCRRVVTGVSPGQPVMRYSYVCD